jgi:hypothetical protein
MLLLLLLQLLLMLPLVLLVQLLLQLLLMSAMRVQQLQVGAVLHLQEVAVEGNGAV